MPEFDFKRSSKRCSATERTLAPGEEYVSALLETDDGMQRLDFGLDHWNEPPDHCIGWWRAKVPDATEGKVYWAPDEVLRAFYQNVRTAPGHEDIAYVMTLLMVQKRLLKLEEFIDTDDGQRMAVLDRHEKETFEVPVVDLAPDRLAEIQDELGEKLFTDQPMELGDTGDEPDE
jgi:hypothetical protein